MAMKKLEEVYGEELNGLLSEGLDFIAQFPSCPPFSRLKRTYYRNQAIIKGVFTTMFRDDIEEFSTSNRAENLPYFQHPFMKSLFKGSQLFSKKVVEKCIGTLAEMVVEERLFPQPALIASITGLEEKYHLAGLFVQKVIYFAKSTDKASNKKKSAEVKTISTQTSLEPAVNPYNTQMFLVQERADPVQRPFPMRPSLQCPAELENRNIIDKVYKLREDLRCGESISVLINISVVSKRIEILRTVLWHGVDPQFLNKGGNAPEHISDFANCFMAVKSSTSNTAKRSQINQSGQLPPQPGIEPKTKSTNCIEAGIPEDDNALFIALYNCEKRTVEALKKFEDKPGMTHFKENMPLLVVMKSYDQEMAEFLTEQGAVVIEKLCPLYEYFKKSNMKEQSETETGSEKEDSYVLKSGASQDQKTGYCAKIKELTAEDNEYGTTHTAASEHLESVKVSEEEKSKKVEDVEVVSNDFQSGISQESKANDRRHSL